ncbi:MAG: hypothetical protein RML57_03895, partial [Acidobacteriota bacterium]|nr:hypothetical protein [Acidobacteriota bacterium]
GHVLPVTSVAFAPDGTRVVTGSWDGAVIWDAASGRALVKLEGQEDRVWSVAFAPDGTRVVTGSWDGTDHHLGRGERAGAGQAGRAQR